MLYEVITIRPIFIKNGLPKIGDSVVLNVTTPLYSREEILQNIDIFKHYKSGLRDFTEAGYDHLNNRYEILYDYPNKNNGNFPMQPNAKLKILAYETFSHGGFLGLFADKYLFAKVEVLDDGEYEF